MPLSTRFVGRNMKYHELTKIIESSPDALGFSRDNPGGEWLERQRARAKELGRFGVGALTGTFGMSKPLEIRVDYIKDLKGVRGEEEFRHNSPKMDQLKAEVAKHGWKPEHPPMLWVKWDGEAKIAEGNHRITLAAGMGIEWIPIDIRYFAGGEDIAGPLNPALLVDKGLVRPRSG